ncbi:uncharacterized protein LOC108099197 isoform X1 [Drosophila ficusphila]|uniref:uncharacterized protein LOC108099197 isoform X1 n=1 Tax=Drosophila ficusphila TaxID=30025 RepID=UPI0007E85A55|nr:uncharacterized protein LOC108099197 isoform X1 [Drosophila ficusphila]
MSSLLRRYFTFLFVVVSFVGFSLVEDQIIQKEPMLASFRQETQELQDEFVHLADRCSIEKVMEEDSPEYLQINCLVDSLPEGYARRLKPVDYGRSFFLNQRIPQPLKRQWNFRVPKDAVNGLSLLT